MIDKCNIDRVKSIKFLDIIIDDSLNRQDHVDLATDNISKTVDSF